MTAPGAASVQSAASQYLAHEGGQPWLAMVKGFEYSDLQPQVIGHHCRARMPLIESSLQNGRACSHLLPPPKASSRAGVAHRSNDSPSHFAKSAQQAFKV